MNESPFTHSNVAPCITRILLLYSQTPPSSTCSDLPSCTVGGLCYCWPKTMHIHAAASQQKPNPLPCHRHQYAFYISMQVILSEVKIQSVISITNMLQRISVLRQVSPWQWWQASFLCPSWCRTSNSSAVILSSSLNPILSSTCQHCNTNKGEEIKAGRWKSSWRIWCFSTQQLTVTFVQAQSTVILLWNGISMAVEGQRLYKNDYISNDYKFHSPLYLCTNNNVSL